MLHQDETVASLEEEKEVNDSVSNEVKEPVTDASSNSTETNENGNICYLRMVWELGY